ncbi:TonB family protein, partial [Roseibacterium sp. SDUM158017]|uniref:TonB family protein n=1 Tax=Roseicyclus salinarum TaxID=3036773 RepID=UPI002414F8FE
SASAGRAAARYPQAVNRHLSRLRRPSARFDGAAVIAFTVGPGGGLAALGVARSSGSAEFDGLALEHLRRAVPFPDPPPGAQLSYSVTVRGR